MRLKKMAKKVMDNITNPEDTQKLNKWKNKLENARISYGSELDRIKRREELYKGDRKVNGNPNSNRSAKKLAINVRNIVYELIETQVDSSIPAPRVIPIHQEDENAAKVIENFLINEMRKLAFERINDQDERTTFVQGGDFFHLEWDPSKGYHTTMGDITVSCRHPKQVIPQPGVNDFDKMDYFFIQYNMTKDFIKRKYNVDVELADLDLKLNDKNNQYVEDVATVTQAYYRNKDGGIGIFVWCDDYILEDMEDYQKRRIMVCTKCGKPKDGDVCECGSKKFKEEIKDKEVITERIETFGDLVIEPTYEEEVPIKDLDGKPALDEMGIPFMSTETRNTEIPYYKPNCFPIVLRKNVTKYDSFLGSSDVDVIEDQQDAISKIGSKIQEKILMGGSYLMLPKGLEVETNESEYKIIRVDQSNAGLINVKTTQADISQDLTMLAQNYDFARSSLGITDAFQGKYDASARSGSAKQYSINQAAGRLDSKRIMKNQAYAMLYEMMFKFALAYADQPMPISGESRDGTTEYSVFDRYMFLKQDEAGEYFWNDEFTFTTVPTSTLMTNREAMWEQIDMKLQSGAFGQLGDLDTNILYWKLMEKNGYPNAGIVKDSIEQRLAEQKGAMEQNEMSTMPGGNGDNQIDLQGLLGGIPGAPLQ